MERMADGQDSWARWKSIVLGLPPTQSHSYLRDVEGFEPERIARFLGGEDAAIAPADWEVTAQSRAAVARFEAWEERLAVLDNGAALLDYQETRAAALPGQAEIATNSAPLKEEDS